MVYAWASDALPVCGMRRRPWLLLYNLVACACFLATGLLVETYAAALAAGVATQVCLCGSEVMLDSLVVDRVVDGGAGTSAHARTRGHAHSRASPPCPPSPSPSPDAGGAPATHGLAQSLLHARRSPRKVVAHGVGRDGSETALRDRAATPLLHVELEQGTAAGQHPRRASGANGGGGGGGGGTVIGALQANCLMARYLGTMLATAGSVGALAAGASPRALVTCTAALPLVTAILAVVAIRERRVSNSCGRCVTQRPFASSETVPGGVSGAAGSAALVAPHPSVCTLLRRLCRAAFIGDPLPLWPLLLFVFVLKAVPSTTAVLPSFYLDVIGMKNWEYSLIDAVQAAGSALGCALYARYLSRAPLWRVLCATTVVAALSGCTQLLLSQGTYKAMHVPGVVLAGVDGVVVGATGAVAFLPVVVLASAAAPVGLEATAFAAMLSVTDLAGSASDYLSSLLAGALGVSRGHWTSLGWMILVCNALRVAPVLLCWPLRRKVNQLLRTDGTRAGVGT